MKLTKAKLRQIISEELKEADAMAYDKTSAADVRSGAMDAAKEQSSGLTDQERGLIQKLISMLVSAAKNTNLTSGPAAQKINQLAAVLQKVVGQPAEEVPTEPAVESPEGEL